MQKKKKGSRFCRFCYKSRNELEDGEFQYGKNAFCSNECYILKELIRNESRKEHGRGMEHVRWTLHPSLPLDKQVSWIMLSYPEFVKKQKKDGKDKALKVHYDRFGKRCAVCHFDRALEYCHLIPDSYDGPRIVENMIILCANHHYLFDREKLNFHEKKAIISYIKTYYDNSEHILNFRGLECMVLPEYKMYANKS